ncbi:TetR/AcrR family transcriptional regulator [Capillimicrobium parvum]|nr:TetR/AcrR family transcriptional regulator [Capillimicrobium parvum]
MPDVSSFSAMATTSDGRLLRGEQTRRAILQRAADIASVEGLEGLSIGRLAAELGASKSGVFAHFGSKEELQLATVEAARERFVEAVVVPALKAPRGLRRLSALCDGWLAYAREPVFAGGCFFCAVDAEFNARPGRVRDALAVARRDWIGLFVTTIEGAQGLGEIDPGVDARQLTFELDAFLLAANTDALLYDDPVAYERASTAMRARLRSAASDPALVG